MDQERQRQNIGADIWLPPLLFGCFALAQAGLMAARIRPASLCVAGAATFAACVFCVLFIIAWVRKDTVAAARRLFLCAVLGMHGIWAYWGTLYDWTSLLLYLLSETPTCIAFLYLFRKTDEFKAIRTAYTFLAAKTILVDLPPIWLTDPARFESVPPDAAVFSHPLVGLPAMLFLGIQFAALGIYVYKLTKDPARWKKAIWV